MNFITYFALSLLKNEIQYISELSSLELGRDWNRTGTRREPVRDGTYCTVL